MSITMRGSALAAVLAGLALAAGAAAAPAGTPLSLEPPMGLEEVPVPDDNPMTAEKVDLGKQLYFDKRLSGDGTVACATCHDPRKGWADGMKVSSGIKGQKGARNAPTVLNTAYGMFQFWDGRAASLEEQALGPIQNPIEMGESLDAVAKKLSAIAGYRSRFQKVFGTDVTPEGIARAIAAFERTALSGGSAWDRYEAGDKSALTPSAVRGLDLFRTKANCNACHAGFNLSDGVFHNLGVGWPPAKGAEPDLGRFAVTKEPKDRGAFKTPTLRDITRTAPYMHDGSEATLEQVVDFYDRGGNANPDLDVQMKPLKLTDQEKADLIAFLRSLEGKPIEVEPPALPQ